MNEVMIERAMSSAFANLRLIKTLASQDFGRARELIDLAATCSEHCLRCVRSCETGSVLPETLDTWCESCQKLLDFVEKNAMDRPELDAELSACTEAWENCIKACHRQTA